MKVKHATGIALLILGVLGTWHLVLSDATETTPLIESGGKYAVATFAGGCFWCVESDFEKLPGVNKVISGYSGGNVPNPTYKQVSAGGTGHAEAVQVYYDPGQISYEALLESLWRQIDPTDGNGQFVDRGRQYRPAVFYHDGSQKRIAERSLDRLDGSGRYDRPLAVEVTPFERFYEAEEYHQDYYRKNPLRYKFYRHRSGRDQYLEAKWGSDLQFDVRKYGERENGPRYFKPSDEELTRTLTPLQYQVTQEAGTERPFQNEYWDEKREGIYVDIVSGEPLFSSADKFDSGTGWPSFTKPIDERYIQKRTDYKLIFPRTEIRSTFGDSHLGHVFDDGPEPTGLRYCVNSAALRFVPKGQLADSGYAVYVELFP